MTDWVVNFIDRGREPQCAPDPKFPEGMHVDISRGASKTCTGMIVYPALRCGYYSIKCRKCGTTALITVAGRPDDVRSVTVACKGH